MSVNNVNSSQSIFEQISQQNQESSTAAKSADSDSDLFMKLMIAQLKNQDPSSPADTTDFMQQIATMSTVESINKLNTTMEDMAGSMLSSQAALQASSMVGQSVYAESEGVILDESKQIKGMIDLETSASDIRISVYDQSGNRVNGGNLGATESGNHDFSIDMSGAEEGAYRVVIEAQVDGEYTQIPGYLAHNVNSVTLGQNGIGMKVNTDAGSFSLDDVKQIG